MWCPALRWRPALRTGRDEELFFADLSRRFGRRGGGVQLSNGLLFGGAVRGGLLCCGLGGGELRGGGLQGCKLRRKLRNRLRGGGLRNGLLGAGAGAGFRDGFAESLFGLSGANGLVLLLNAGNGIEEELREVADGKGVVAVNALVGKLPDGVGEEDVDAIGGVEVAGGVEEFGGDGFGVGP